MRIFSSLTSSKSAEQLRGSANCCQKFPTNCPSNRNFSRFHSSLINQKESTRHVCSSSLIAFLSSLMSTPSSNPIDDQQFPSPYPTIVPPEPILPTKSNHPFPSDRWTDRFKTYFLTTDGRIALARILMSLICVILQHTMGTCKHHISNGTNDVQWHVFTPPCRFIRIKSVPRRISLCHSWRGSTHSDVLLRPFLDDVGLLFGTHVALRHNGNTFFEETRHDRSCSDRATLSARSGFQYLGWDEWRIGGKISADHR